MDSTSKYILFILSDKNLTLSEIFTAHWLISHDGKDIALPGDNLSEKELINFSLSVNKALCDLLSRSALTVRPRYGLHSVESYEGVEYQVTNEGLRLNTLNYGGIKSYREKFEARYEEISKHWFWYKD